MPLHQALRLAAVAAATEDPRFDPLRPKDLDTVRFEVTVLDEPALIRAGTPQEYISAITPGRDGLIVRRGEASGLLLPQVAAEYGWSAREFLENTCRKAGLDPDGGDAGRHRRVQVRGPRVLRVGWPLIRQMRWVASSPLPCMVAWVRCSNRLPEGRAGESSSAGYVKRID